MRNTSTNPPEARSADLAAVCATIGQLGSKLDRIEDALHDIAQVLARHVGPPWDMTEN